MMETGCLHTRTWQWHCLGILFLTLETYLGKANMRLLGFMFQVLVGCSLTLVMIWNEIKYFASKGKFFVFSHWTFCEKKTFKNNLTVGDYIFRQKNFTFPFPYFQFLDMTRKILIWIMEKKMIVFISHISTCIQFHE